ncbi:MAG: ATP-binding cassette domain-containing protein [Proteobacteria bacterium]|nr:ATP-binding cassette domain-containing protein [Pseudomonadota bacterium]
MLTISNLTYRVAGRLILEDASATVMEGRRVGVVGANGAGKSTLFKLIMGELHSDGGEVSLSDRYSVGVVRQDIGDMDMALLDVVLSADVERDALLKAAETEQDPYKIGDIYARLDEIDAYAAPARASSILAGLGFKEEQMGQPLRDFSGGWRMRVALAAALFRQPDFLLLDEPTNHLDLEAIMWLEAYLASYPKTLMVISHDRELLNKCVTHVLHVENRKLTSYTGDYNTFERERAEKLMSQQKLHEKQAAARAHMQAFVDRFKAKASKAKQAQSRLKALEKMDVVDAVIADRGVKFNFPQPEELAPPVLGVHKVDVGYSVGKPVLRDINERIDMDDRIALLGANGNGKSTLIKLIAGKLAPLAGDVQKAGKLRIGYFSQHQTDELDVDESPLAAMMRAMQGKKEFEVRAVLGRFGFSKTLADNKIASLSGGEKARLLFALMSYNAPHLLLLDEPTNHLDMDSREALVEALNAYSGAVVIVSHDPSMIERVADRLWLVAEGKCQVFDGDLAAYRDYVIEQRRQERRKEKKAAVVDAGPDKKELARQRKEKKKQFPDLAAQAEEGEKAVAKLLAQRKRLEAQMADPAFYADQAAMQEAQVAYGKLLREVEEAEEAWLEAEEAFERA